MPKLLVVGAGAVGAYYAAMVEKHHPGEVVLLARGESHQAIRKNGVRVITDKTDETIRVAVTDRVETIAQPDYVLIASKMYDLEATLEQTKSLLAGAKGVFGIQNGIEKEQMMARYAKGAPLHATTQVGCDRIAPGVIRHAPSRRTLFIGEADNSKTERVLEVSSLMTSPEVDCVVPEDIQLQLWLKFIGICANAGVCSVALCDGGQAFSYEPTRRLMEAAQREGYDVGIAHYPSAITQQRKEETLKNFLNRPRGAPGAGRGEGRSHIPSMAADYMEGRRTEIEYLNGAMVRKAREKGVPVPVHEMIYAAVSAPKYKAHH